MGIFEAAQHGDMERVFLLTIEACQPSFSFLFILLFVAASFAQENHPYLFGLLVVTYLFTQGFRGKDRVEWSTWSFPYRTTGKAFAIVAVYICIGALWAVFRSTLNIIRLDRLATPEVVDFYKECHANATALAQEAQVTTHPKGPIFCTQADYIYMMGLQKVGFLKSMLIWPFDVVRMLFTELFRLTYDVAFSLYQQHGGKLLRWADGVRQNYAIEEL